MSKIVLEILKRYGAIGMLCLVTIGGTVWYMAHANAKEGETIKLFWGMLEYTKPIEKLSQIESEPTREIIEVSA